MFLPWSGRIFGMQSLLIEFMSSYALTKSLTSLALCSCVFISDTCESLSLNRDHSAAPACGMLLPASIPCRNQQCVKMDCVCFFLYPLLNTFFFFKVFQRSVFLLLLWDELPAAGGTREGIEAASQLQLEWQTGSGMWGQGNSNKESGEGPLEPFTCWCCSVGAAGGGEAN